MLNFQIRGEVVTCDDFWDCGCEKDYINRKAYHRKCNVCGWEEGESPDSQAEEVLLYHEDLTLKEKQEILRAIKKAYWEHGLGKSGDRKLEFNWESK